MLRGHEAEELFAIAEREGLVLLEPLQRTLTVRLKPIRLFMTSKIMGLGVPNLLPMISLVLK